MCVSGMTAGCQGGCFSGNGRMGGAPAARGADGGSAETAEAARRLQHSEGTSEVRGVESGAGGCLTPAPGHFIGSSKCSASFRVVAGESVV